MYIPNAISGWTTGLLIVLMVVTTLLCSSCPTTDQGNPNPIQKEQPQMRQFISPTSC